MVTPDNRISKGGFLNNLPIRGRFLAAGGKICGFHLESVHDRRTMRL